MRGLRKGYSIGLSVHPAPCPWGNGHGHRRRSDGFKAICGSSPATAATFASVAFLKWIDMVTTRNYPRESCHRGTLGILIPPSVTLIVFGIITEQSIGKLFLAGLIPGLIIAFFFICIIYVWCRINPKLGPRVKDRRGRKGLPPSQS